ncbi:hypothetical protein [Reyranella sp.]|uniref:hypothetical protein n=1 Tax=Reyranella sp. TaxID=1929291 RepID=UPI003BAB3B5F
MEGRTTLRALATAGLALCGASAVLLLASEAQANNCLDRVREIAATYGLSTDPPTVTPDQTSKPLDSQKLAQSGGVVQPPPTSDRSVIEPPRDARYGMSTLPDITPPRPKSEDRPAAKTLGAAETATLQAALIAARAQAERGMEAQCLQDLSKAETVIERAK